MQNPEATTEALLVVPKHDELRATAVVFGIEPNAPSGSLNDRWEYWCVRLAGLNIRILCADSQSSEELALASNAALVDFSPTIAVCLGTAAGNPTTNYLDVILATHVLNAQEWRARDQRLLPQWQPPIRTSRDARHDIDDFVKATFWRLPAARALANAVETDQASAAESSDTAERLVADLLKGWPTVQDAWIATTSILYQDENQLSRIWDLHARIKCVDMESSGFVSACTSRPQVIPWFVIRAISDHGSTATKSDGKRFAAGAAAAVITRLMLEGGLQRTHPLRLAPIELGEQKLSTDNFYTSLNIRSFIQEELRQQPGSRIDASSLTPDVSIEDLASVQWDGQRAIQAFDLLDRIRELYFTKKYLHYDDEADIRAHLGVAWIEDVHRAYTFLGANVQQSDVLYVGVGTGRDLNLVCPEFKTLTGVDVSREMLAAAKAREPRLVTNRDMAERLDSIPDESVDLYLSLRTYQSALLDIPSALRQALRVMRPKAGLVISIPGGYLDRTSDNSIRYVPGLLFPGSADVVDRGRPRSYAQRILTQLENLMFDRIGFHQQETDLYIYARKR